MNKVKTLIKKELKRQNEGIELIASENYPSMDVRDAQGSILTCKYAEGYPNKRYYGGCTYIDQVEYLAIDTVTDLFDCRYANVQPHSGSQANAAAYRALEVYLMKHGKLDVTRKMKILSLVLNDGGHLTHGSSVSFSSHLYDFSFFPLAEDGKIDLQLLEDAIIENKPDVVLMGCSAYPFKIDFRAANKVIRKYDCMFMVDMAHIAGLVAAERHLSPCPVADIVTSTTHKTLRGPRGGLILTNNEELYKYVNSAVFPYYQGGPLEHVIAAKTICFMEASKRDFKKYIKQVQENTQIANDFLASKGCIVSGTETHLFLLNTKLSFRLTGIQAQERLEKIGITTNKNMIHGDTEKPSVTSGLRIGFAAVTSRGCDKMTAVKIAEIIYEALSQPFTKQLIRQLKADVKAITANFADISKLKF